MNTEQTSSSQAQPEKTPWHAPTADIEGSEITQGVINNDNTTPFDGNGTLCQS
jgi:hypothetical protein